MEDGAVGQPLEVNQLCTLPIAVADFKRPPTIRNSRTSKIDVCSGKSVATYQVERSCQIDPIIVLFSYDVHVAGVFVVER